MPAPLPHRPPTADAAHASVVVALEAGDLDGREQVQAARLVEECPACAELLADLAAIRLATAALPAAPRTRDFRLTEADARRLSPTPWRSFLRWLAAPGSSVRPLAGGLATLGIVGALLTASPAFLTLGSAAAPLAAPSTGGAAPVLGPAKGGDASAAPVQNGQPAPVPSMAAAPAATLVPGATPAAYGMSSAPSPAFVAAPSAPANDRAAGAGTGSTASGEGAGAGAGTPPGLAPLPSSGPAEGGPDRTVPFALSLTLLAAGALLLAGRILARRAAAR